VSGTEDDAAVTSEAALSDLLAVERRRADSVEQRLRNQTLLFAEAEHKMKTTLAAITGWATTLEENWAKLDDTLRQQGVGAIRRNADDLSLQVRRLLSEAQADMAEVDLEPVRMELNTVLRTTRALFEGVSSEHRVVFEPSPDDVWALVDPAGFEQILGHLIDNAMKYSPQGGTITLRTFLNGGTPHVEVSDEGSGIPEGMNLFAAFQRGDEATDGAGLGLYIVRNLVESMSGHITGRRNADAAGSTFTVVLPPA
jgi:signal transduction histidine kinase